MIEYDINLNEYRTLTNDDRQIFLLDSTKFLHVTEDIYKKAEYFYKKMGRVPFISTSNLVFNPTEGTVQFYAIGEAFKSFYVINTVRVSTEDPQEIPRLISMFWRKFLFEGSIDKEKSYFRENRNISSLFIQLILGKLGAKEPHLRYSYKRVKYLQSKAKDIIKLSDQYASLAHYLQERFLSSVFHFCESTRNWENIAKCLRQFYSELVEIAIPSDAKYINYRNITTFSREYRKCHSLSIALLNLAESIKASPYDTILSSGEFDLFYIGHYFSVSAVEITSLTKSVFDLIPSDISSVSKLPMDCRCIKCGDIDFLLDSDDVMRINSIISRYIMKKELFDKTYPWSITHLTISLHLIFSNANKQNADLHLNNNGVLDAKQYTSLAELALVIVPRMENRIIQSVSDAVDRFASPLVLQRINDTEIFIDGTKQVSKTSAKIRKTLHLRRLQGKIINQLTLPYLINCQKYIFSKKYKISSGKLNPSPLNVEVTRSCRSCSWDVFGKNPTDITVTNDRLIKTTQILRKDKIFGVPLRGFWYGRPFVIILCIYAILLLCIMVPVSAMLQGDLWNGVLWILRNILWALLLAPLSIFAGLFINKLKIYKQ
jgi:hypothetical protein